MCRYTTASATIDTSATAKLDAVVWIGIGVAVVILVLIAGGVVIAYKAKPLPPVGAAYSNPAYSNPKFNQDSLTLQTPKNVTYTADELSC